MIRPAIHGCNFPYRGPKSRRDISGLLTSAKYDILRGQDFINKLNENKQEIMLFYCTGKTSENINRYIKYYEAGVPEQIFLDKNIALIEGMKRTATNLLFGD